mmetsp:Transcript_6326/g.26197  ORF Transcript_6326/g.26197 Transcript_6326/m.26197 type:complete len:432 (-) Transcript_6326:626-1921(-)
MGQRCRRLPHRLVPAVDSHLQLAPRLLLPARHQPRAVDGDPGGTHHLGLDHEVLERGRRRAEHRDEVAALEVHRQRRPRRRASNLEDVLAPAGNVVALEAVGALDGLHRERLDAAREEDLADLVLDVLGARLEGAKQRAARLLSRRLVRAFRRLLRRSLQGFNLPVGVVEDVGPGNHKHASLHAGDHRARRHRLRRRRPGRRRVHRDAPEEKDGTRVRDVLVRVDEEKRERVGCVERKGSVGRELRGGGVHLHVAARGGVVEDRGPSVGGGVEGGRGGDGGAGSGDSGGGGSNGGLLEDAPRLFRGDGGGARGLVVGLLLLLVVVHRDGGGGVVGVHRVALVALAGVNRAQRWLERVLALGFILGGPGHRAGRGPHGGRGRSLGGGRGHHRGLHERRGGGLNAGGLRVGSRAPELVRGRSRRPCEGLNRGG